MAFETFYCYLTQSNTHFTIAMEYLNFNFDAWEVSGGLTITAVVIEEPVVVKKISNSSLECK